MTSQKNSSLKYCIKCTILLNEENWNIYDQKSSHYLCKKCRKIQDKKTKNNIEYNQKQAARYHSRKSAVIHFYGDECIKCGENEYEKLTIDYFDGNIKNYNYLYNSTIDKDKYQILCHNCHATKNTIYKDKYALRDKIKVINKYGGECILCQENKIERLIIAFDKKPELTGIHMYRWIIKNNYPNNLGLQILCYNCQSVTI